MKNLKKLSALALTTVFASMQMSMAAVQTNLNLDTGLGAGLGGAIINSVRGGWAGLTTGINEATLNFNGNAHVSWDSLNLDYGETLNFNAVDGVTGLTILNTVAAGQGNMSQIYGNINANSGIKHLIISNPNGMLFDGAHFTAAGDVMLTSHLITCDNIEAANPTLVDTLFTEHNARIDINNSQFDIGGNCDIYAKFIGTRNSHYNVAGEKGLRLVTMDGYNFGYDNLVTGNVGTYNPDGVYINNIDVNGDVLVVAMDGQNVRLENGSYINGNFTVDAVDNVIINVDSNGNLFTVTGDVNITGNARHMVVQNSDIGGNLYMNNGGGYIELGNSNVGGDATLITTAITGGGYPSYDYYWNYEDGEYSNYILLNGDVNIDGDLNIESSQNIVFGGQFQYITEYDEEQGIVVNDHPYTYYADGYDDYGNNKLTGTVNVGGNVNAHSTNGHIIVNQDVTAGNKITLKSDNLNILTNGNGVLSANEYELYSKGYIGGMGTYEGNNLEEVMVNYIFVPVVADETSYLTVTGGTISKLVTDGDAYIASLNDLQLTGANVKGDINLTAYDSRIDITGNDVHATNINIGDETETLKVEWPGRDYTLNYTDIRSGQVVTINPDEVITYELANSSTGYNTPEGERGDDTTFLIAPDGGAVEPDTPYIDPNENAKLLRNGQYMDRIAEQPVNTPAAFAADLDDDGIASAVRKNVDGSVTVTRTFKVK